MKKGIAIVVVLLAGAIFLASSFAEEKQGAMMGKDMLGKEMMKGRDSDMGAMMMKMMMGKSMIATEDGGIVVMMGNKLLKYDKNLNLKKEVKIEVDFSEMEEMMKKCKQMKKKQCMKEEKSDESEEPQEVE